MTHSDSNKTKKLGQYYSPSFIVHFILKNTLGEFIKLNRTLIAKSVKLLDPSVGQGIFLIEALRSLLKVHDHSESANISKIKKRILEHQLYGIDVDLEQVLATRNHLGCSEFDGNIRQFDALTESWEESFPETEGKFNVIVGNPPWGADITAIKGYFPEELKTATAQMDSWSLFIERCIMGLHDEGYLGFIVPNTLLTNPNYTQIRKVILKSSIIIKIVNLGEDIFPEVTQPCMILIINKRTENQSHQIWVVPKISKEEKDQLKKGKMSLDQCKHFTCPQSRFVENTLKEFDILSLPFDSLIQTIEKDLYSHQNQTISLGTLVTNGRGVEIGRNGKVVICPSCDYHNPPPREKRECRNSQCNKWISPSDESIEIISDFSNESPPNRPFLTGYQIQRYFTHKSRYIDTQCYGVNYKTPQLYQGPKLLLRKTGKGMNWVIDYQDRWVSQVVYIFKMKKNLDERYHSITLEYLLGVLNSKVMQQYINAKFLDPERTDFPHFIQKKILQLPIKTPSGSREENLVHLIGEKALRLQNLHQKQYELNSNLKSKILSSENEIETFIKKLYSLL